MTAAGKKNRVISWSVGYGSNARSETTKSYKDSTGSEDSKYDRGGGQKRI